MNADVSNSISVPATGGGGGGAFAFLGSGSLAFELVSFKPDGIFCEFADFRFEPLRDEVFEALPFDAEAGCIEPLDESPERALPLVFDAVAEPCACASADGVATEFEIGEATASWAWAGGGSGMVMERS